MTSAGLEIIAAPLDLLRTINIVDTPGTNAVRREHEALTREFVPRSDLVLFVTSADRPFTESERAFLQSIRDWGKKIVLVVNKVDLLRDDEAREQVRAFVERQPPQRRAADGAGVAGHGAEVQPGARRHGHDAPVYGARYLGGAARRRHPCPFGVALQCDGHDL